MRSALTRAAIVAVAACASLCLATAADEICVPCPKEVLLAQHFIHQRAFGSTRIEGAPRRGDEAFREEICGTNFTLTISDLPAGRYTIQIGLVEVDYDAPGQRVFDISSGSQVLVSNLDIFAAAGGAGKVYFVNGQVDHEDDAVHGPLALTFTARTNVAKLNSLEVFDTTGRSLVYMRAADLVDAEDADLLKLPAVGSGPELWKDPAQPMKVRVDDLLRRLSVAEKVQQMRNAAPAIPRLGIPAYNYWNECLHGVARAGVATVFPQAIGLAATWDAPLLRQTADVIATEARAKHNDYVSKHDGNSGIFYGLTFWTPNINIFRDPRWGRGQETYGEDPFLAGRLAVAFIRGLQGDDPNYIKAMACAKHFAVHSGPEPERHSFDAVPPERDLYETYLPHFEAAVREGHVGAVMGAYNRVNGEPACSSPFLLTELLRRQWGFTGHVVSDCGAIHDISANHKTVATPAEAAARAVKAGCDLCCGTDYGNLLRAVKTGLITGKEIDTALAHVLEARFRLGLFDPPARVPYAQIPITENDTAEHAALALRAARESMVLLKNSGLLPLNRARIKRIAVIGTNANSVPLLLGNYNGTPSHPITLLEGIRQIAGTNIQVTYEPGCPLAVRKAGTLTSSNSVPSPQPARVGREGETAPGADFTRAVAAARAADVVIYVGGINARLEGEEMMVNYEGFSGGDRTRIELPTVQEELLKALHATGKPVVFVNCSGSAVATPWAAKNLSALLQAWYPGEQGGRAVAEVLFGDVNPAGRLPVTFYRSTDDLPPFEEYSMSNRTYRYFNGQPLFAFGHGLSYTRFDYQHAKLAATRVTAKGVLKLTFEIANKGSRDGDEVAQVYFRHVKSALPQAKLALCAFDRVRVPKGKTARVDMEIPVERFRYWDTTQKRYAVEPGQYELLLGAASDDIRARLPVTVLGQ
jgi:beta-glucosidase